MNKAHVFRDGSVLGVKYVGGDVVPPSDAARIAVTRRMSAHIWRTHCRHLDGLVLVSDFTNDAAGSIADELLAIQSVWREDGCQLCRLMLFDVGLLA